MVIFGPVPSRRLGNSLGLNNIPHKICPYSCVYCQVGRTRNFDLTRREFISTEHFASEVEEKVRVAIDAGKPIDYVSFVPDGEPTLDLNLGRTIDRLGELGVKIAVISNSSLVTDPDVRSDLKKADWVSLKFDSVVKNVWKKVNRPRSTLKIEELMEGARRFADEYTGTFVTETMMVDGINDGEDSAVKTAAYIRSLEPSIAYLSIPTRPPAESRVTPPTEKALGRAYGIYAQQGFTLSIWLDMRGTLFQQQAISRAIYFQSPPYTP